MIGLFVILTALAVVPVGVFALAGAMAAAPMATNNDVRTFAWSLFWQVLLVIDCVTLGYLAARW